MRGEMFIEKCDLQNLSSRGAVCEAQKQHVAPTELRLVDGLLLFLSINISLLRSYIVTIYNDQRRRCEMFIAIIFTKQFSSR